jgi:hypothetical protein
MLRRRIAYIGVPLAIVCFIIGFKVPDNAERWSAFFLHFGSIALEICLTVGLVEWFFERDKERQEAIRIAKSALHDLNYAIWVWTGGRLSIHPKEIEARLKAIKDTDHLEPFTENLLVQLASRSHATLKIQTELLNDSKNVDLWWGLEKLAELDIVRSDPNSTSLASPTMLAGTMSLAYGPLAAMAREKLPPQDLEFEDSIIFETPSTSTRMQRFRYYGDREQS